MNLETLNTIFTISGIISIGLVILFFVLLFKIKNLLTSILSQLQVTRSKEPIQYSVSPDAKDWLCPKCLTVNAKTKFKCSVCDYSL